MRCGTLSRLFKSETFCVLATLFIIIEIRKFMYCKRGVSNGLENTQLSEIYRCCSAPLRLSTKRNTCYYRDIMCRCSGLKRYYVGVCCSSSMFSIRYPKLNHSGIDSSTCC